uniref:Uncharacterized protein n=1 Tax=Strongyloides venezuelensis TaxID=75913 RepID=A0A0K0G385_STRVS
MCSENKTNNLVEDEKVIDDEFKNSKIYKEVLASLIKPAKHQFNKQYSELNKRSKFDNRMAIIERKCHILKALFLMDQEYVVSVQFGNFIYNEKFGTFSIASIQNIIVGVKNEKIDKNEEKNFEKCQRENIVMALNKIANLNKNKKVKVSIINLDEKLLSFLDELQQGRTPSQFREDQDIKMWGIKFLRCTRMEMTLTLSQKTSSYLTDLMNDCCLKNFDVAVKDYAFSNIFYDNE